MQDGTTLIEPDHYNRGIVFAAGGVGIHDELFGRCIGVGIDHQDIPYLIVAEHAVETVAANKDNVAVGKPFANYVNLDLLVATNRSIDNIAVRMDPGFGPGEISCIDHSLNQGVVLG